MPKPGGMFNAVKCIQYLRWIGVEIDDATAAQYLDAEKAHRFVASMKRPAVQYWQSSCISCGFAEVIVRKFRQRREKRRDACPECGGKFRGISSTYTVTRDGTVRDYRPEGERWRSPEEAIR